VLALLIGQTLALCMIMAVGWAFQRARGNGGWTDVFWTFGLGITGTAAALWPIGASLVERRGLVALMVAAWSLRLGLHIAGRVARSPEDVRYAELRTRHGPRFQAFMALFLPLQGLVSAPLLGAILLAAHNPSPRLGIADLLGAVILAAAVAGEREADRQLARFKADPGNRGRICDQGLWAWSRHPNYFFEWLAWLAYPVMALGGGWPPGWLAFGGPLVMFAILRFGTGAPPLEAHMRRSRGEAFEAYRRRTSLFFPLPPRRTGA
jgi:steroid 5-alpha reductase family enzyme